MDGHRSAMSVDATLDVLEELGLRHGREPIHPRRVEGWPAHSSVLSVISEPMARGLWFLERPGRTYRRPQVWNQVRVPGGRIETVPFHRVPVVLHLQPEPAGVLGRTTMGVDTTARWPCGSSIAAAFTKWMSGSTELNQLHAKTRSNAPGAGLPLRSCALSRQLFTEPCTDPTRRAAESNSPSRIARTSRSGSAALSGRGRAASEQVGAPRTFSCANSANGPRPRTLGFPQRSASGLQSAHHPVALRRGEPGVSQRVTLPSTRALSMRSFNRSKHRSTGDLPHPDCPMNTVNRRSSLHRVGRGTSCRATVLLPLAGP